MVFEKDKLKELLANQDVTDTAGLQELMRQMYKEVIETLLQGEMTSHLGYEKSKQTPEIKNNSRNGCSEKTVNTTAGSV